MAPRDDDQDPAADKVDTQDDDDSQDGRPLESESESESESEPESESESESESEPESESESEPETLANIAKAAPKPLANVAKAAPKPARIFDSNWVYLLLIPIVVVVWLVFNQSKQNALLEDTAPDAATIVAHPLTDADQDPLADALGKAWAGQAVERATLPARLLEKGQPVYIAFRDNGERLYDLWRTPDEVASGTTTWDVLLQALEDGRRKLGDKAARVDRLEIDLSHSYRKLDYNDPAQRKQIEDVERGVNYHFGVRGLQIQLGDKQKRYAPTWFISKNRKNPKQLKLARNDWGVTEAEFATATFHSFEADQVLVRLDRSPVEAVVMFRGNRLVDIGEVTQQSTEALATGMANWLINNTEPDGRLVYHYYPSPAEEAKGNNMIRQWMATNAMVRWAHDRSDQAVFDLVEKNIDYNLAHFFHYERNHQRVDFSAAEPVPDDVLGVIEWVNKVKLGGLSLAGMAMWLHPKREKWIDEINALRRTVDSLWHEDGTFTSFYKGSTEEFPNFYPGEAMLWWSVIYAETKDPEILRKFKLSFAYYRKWHLEPDNRNPAFVPWHLQADYLMWTSLGPEEQAFKDDLAAFMYETANWLVDVMQQWDEGEYVYPDERGRFYSAGKGYGVPHASSTGVYLEGLIDAWQLARDQGNEDRKEFYRVSMVRGLRSMMQLQFVDDVDMFYVREPKRVEGGIRTTVFDNRIRCDNVQHPMMGIIKILRMFGADEYGGAE